MSLIGQKVVKNVHNLLLTKKNMPEVFSAYEFNHKRTLRSTVRLLQKNNANNANCFILNSLMRNKKIHWTFPI